TKGTTSKGKQNNKKNHVRCKRCGKSSYHKQKNRCSSCAYPASRLRTTVPAKRRN
ncbi:MAG: 60S ribosomal protein L37, partial [Paramarteilia canceri]